MLMMASGLTYFDKFTYHEREIHFYQEETKFVIFCLLQTFPNEGTLTHCILVDSVLLYVGCVHLSF